MEDQTPAIHEVVAYTSQLEVRGEVRAWPPRRILDVLNSEQLPYLTVDQASIVPLSRWGKAQPAGAESVILNKDEIIMVWLVRETEVERPLLVAKHKIPQRVTAYAGPFVAQGTLHVIREVTLAQALDAMSERFIALTEPSVLCLSVAELVLRGGIVLGLNKDKVMAMQVA